MNKQEQYMHRCITLAQKGAGYVAPNPMVGAVLVYNDTIIGEGWHQAYGQAHAEVNCLNAVKEEHKPLVQESTLYVSLEPCAHFGKTPPCADLIIAYKIPRVVIGCTDSFDKVSGRGIAKLRAAGVTVVNGVLEKECRWLNRRFFTVQEKHRPYIILKWAQSEDGFLAPEKGKRVMLSNVISQQMVHKMRSEESAILVGYNTATNDNPRLNNRYGTGPQPVRIVIDPELGLADELQLFAAPQKTIIFNHHKEEQADHLQWIKLDRNKNTAEEILTRLKHLNSLIVEGGNKTLQMFIDNNLWDEAIVFKTPHLLHSGTKAPVLKDNLLLEKFNLINDTVNIYRHEQP
jgi:diaminohydroxyphosphoribosylaminopyrimidine deaminase/5-amino-6-(5-phosphoribosylamino)uracil reductase